MDWKALKPQGYVSDFADVIDPASQGQLEAYCAAVERATGAQIALVTIPSLEGEPIEDVANTIFRAWGVGQKGKNEGITAAAGRSATAAAAWKWATGWNPSFPMAWRAACCARCGRRCASSDYGEALMAAAETIGDTIAKAKNVTITAQLAPPRTQHAHRLHSLAADPGRHLPAALAAARRRTARLRRRRAAAVFCPA